jgi:hypothetical protein
VQVELPLIIALFFASNFSLIPTAQAADCTYSSSSYIGNGPNGVSGVTVFFGRYYANW